MGARVLLKTKNETGGAFTRYFNMPWSEATDAAVVGARRERSAVLERIRRDVDGPIALVAGAAATLRNNSAAPSGSVQDELLDIVGSEAERLERYASVLIDIAKLTCDAIEMRPEMVALNDVVDEAVKDCAKALRNRRTQLNLPADFCKLWLDRAILRRVLVILIEDAADHTPAGTTVSIQAGQYPTAVRLQVMDEGNGIPPVDVDSIFSRFALRDGDGRSRAGGPLTVCRGYIEAAHWRQQAHSSDQRPRSSS
jgi:two-component system sensor histidine kinase KdpD